jgi:hypothetical protein
MAKTRPTLPSGLVMNHEESGGIAGSERNGFLWVRVGVRRLVSAGFQPVNPCGSGLVSARVGCVGFFLFKKMEKPWRSKATGAGLQVGADSALALMQ